MKTALRIIAHVQLLLCLAVAGCATTATQQNLLVQHCSEQVQALQQQVQRYQVTDSQAQPIAGFPTYRTNRFWSEYANQNLDDQQQWYWRYQLHRLGLQGLAIEWSNLPQHAKDRLLQQVDLISFEGFRQRCGEMLFVDSLFRPLPDKALMVEDSYNDWQRILGLYAITKYGAAGSIAQYQKEMKGYFDSYLPGTLQQVRRYDPGNEHFDSTDWAGKLQQARSANPLLVPELEPLDLRRIAQHFAPSLIIEQRSMADQLGAAEWQHQQRQVNGKQPVVYFNPSYIRYHDQVLLQLNYTLWFSERPKSTRYDWYGGKLDGLVWRVTLSPNGEVLFFDSIHPCGCYHSVHLPQGSELAQQWVDENNRSGSTAQRPLEPILLFQTDTEPSVSRVELSIESDTHYLIHVAATNSEAASGRSGGKELRLIYKLQDYDQLRMLPASSTDDPLATKNWFDNDGIIASSARFERFFLWPMGVPSAGAMRQQGHHAIAFVGKRHFDEASVEALLGLE